MNFSNPVGKQIDSKNIKKKKQKSLKIFVYLIILFVLLLLTGLFFLFSSTFSIMKIEVNGFQRFDNVELSEYLETYKGKNGFSLLLSNNSITTVDKLFKKRLSSLENELEFEFPYISEVSVEYLFPNTLKVTAKERNAVLFLKEHDDYLCIDNQGYVLSIMSDQEFNDFYNRDIKGTCVVKGLASKGYKIGHKIINDDKNIMYNTIKLCTAINENEILMGKINIIDVSTPDSIYFISNPTLRVKFGTFDKMYDKVLKLSAIFESGYDNNSDGLIDFTKSGHDVFIPNKNPGETEGVA